MSRLIWISAETPDVRGGGGQRRQYHQLRVLKEEGNDVRVATLAGAQDDTSLRRLLPVNRFGARRFHGLVPTPSLARIVERCRPERIILAHVESVPMAAAAVIEREVPVLVDFQNVYSRYYEQLGDREEAKRWRTREREALAMATVATACSREEVEALRALSASATVEVAANGVDAGEWPDAAMAQERALAVAFFGSHAHRPNVEGLRWFVDRVWPEVRRAVPEARLLILGPGDAGVPPEPGIELAGRVEDLPTALGAVRVVVVPIVHGVGSRVKFCEALASGAAVVSTSVGCEGFDDVTSGFVRADEPASFAAACVALLCDPVRASALGQVGRALALKRLTWNQTTAALVGFAQGP